MTKLGHSIIAACWLSFMAGVAVRAQEPPDIDLQYRVDKAIEKGIAFLKGKSIGQAWGKPGAAPDSPKDGNELILFTYLHAGVEDSDPHFQKLLKEALEDKLTHTYSVALTAMCMEEYQRVKYQWRIFQCAQFLVDNLNDNGCARYGNATKLSEPPPAMNDVKTTGSKGAKDIKVFGASEAKTKPKVVRYLKVKQQRPGKGGHDHSNMQYLALGLRACHDGGIVFNPALIKKFQRWLQDAQEKPNAEDPMQALILDRMVQQGAGVKRGGTVASREYKVAAAPLGWSYRKELGKGHDAYYGSMTVGSVGALSICSYILDGPMKESWRKDPHILNGLQWLAKNFSVSENPGVDNQRWYYYYMYGLERAGMLFGTETLGTHKWYPEGAEELLKRQQGSGGWGSANNNGIWNTCFAILFLKRATQSLKSIETGRK